MAKARHVFDDEDVKRPFRLMDVLHRRRWWGVLTLLAGLTVAAVVAASLPDVYRSSTTILIERQQIPDELVRSTVTSELEVRLQTISQEILSRSRLEGLIQQYGLYPELRGREPMEALVGRMRRDIDVQMRGERKRGDRSTVAFAVSYGGRDPQRVATVANAVASFYIEENLKVRERQATGTTDFLRTQLEQLKAKLVEQEATVGAFRERHLGELPGQLDANLKTLEQLNGQLRLNSDNQVQANARRAAVEGQLAEVLGFSGGPDALAVRLAELRRELAVLQTQYTDIYPDVIRLKEEIKRLEAQILTGRSDSERGVGLAVSPQVRQLRQALADVDVELTLLKSEADRLRSSISRYQARVEAAPRREQEFQILSREYQSTQEQYRSLMGRHSEAALAESMEQRQKGELFRVIEPALAEEQPAAPKRGRLLLLGLALSLALAGGIMLAREAFDSTVHNRQDIEACVSLPVLVSVPVLLSQSDRRRERRRLMVGAALALVGLLLITGVSYRFARGNTGFSMWVSR